MLGKIWELNRERERGRWREVERGKPGQNTYPEMLITLIALYLCSSLTVQVEWHIP